MEADIAHGVILRGLYSPACPRPTSGLRILLSAPDGTILEYDAEAHVLKIDVEGADLLVLLGATQTIKRFRPVIFAEFNPYWMRQIGQSLDDVRRFAKGAGYRVVRLFADRFLPLPPTHTDSDQEVPSYVLLPEEKSAALPDAFLAQGKNAPTAVHSV